MNLRKMIGIMVIIGLLAVVVPVRPALGEFSDIENHWAKSDIARLYGYGYLKGYPDNTFRPDEKMTRAGFVTALVSCLGGVKGTTAASPFPDTKNHWALPYINQAIKLGIVVKSEYPNGFKPDGLIKRSEASAMLVRALGLKPAAGDLSFSDAAEVEKSMYRGYIQTAYNMGMVTGYSDGTFRPFDTVTRAQACVILSRLIDKKAGNGAGTSTTTVDSSFSGYLSSVQIGDNIYELGKVPVYLRRNGVDTAIYSLQVSKNTVKFNYSYEYPLNSPVSGIGIRVYNNLFSVKSLGVSQKRLVVEPGTRKLASISYDGYKYNPDYLRVYVGSTDQEYYLGDVDIIDAYLVNIGDKTYDLRTTEVVISLQGAFYRINKVLLGSGDTELALAETNAVYLRHPKMSDIDRIYVDSKRITFSSSSSLYFFIDGSRYALSDVTINNSGSFVAGGQTYPCSKVTMLLDGSYYKMKEVVLSDNLFTFYCTSSDSSGMVKINDRYVLSSGVQILKDGTPYNLDDIAVVTLNRVQIGSRRYDLDSTFKARYDGKLYDITRIDYDSGLGMVTMTTKEYTGSYYGASLPSTCVFYESGTVYQNGTSEAYIYVGGNWISFGNLTSLNPVNYYWQGTSYDLIGSRVRIKNTDFKITDAIWRGSSGQLEIYLRRL